MPTICHLSALAIGLLLTTTLAAAQTTPADTTQLPMDQEQVPAAGLPPVPRQARGQWKLGLNNFIANGYPVSQTKDVPGYYTRYGLHLAYERRLGRAWSGQLELSPALLHYRAEGAAGAPVASAQLRAQLAGRYYYNLERRLLRGHRTIGFSANYFALALGLGLSNGPSETPFHLLTDGTGPATDAALLYGVQRRLGRFGFVDATVGVSGLLHAGQWQNFGPVIGLRVGLALPTIAGAAPQEAVPTEVSTLLPRFFAGVQFGDARYFGHYSRANPYPANRHEFVNGYEKETNFPTSGTGGTNSDTGPHTYENDRTWYLYGGYYLTPRLALQLGVQAGTERNRQYSSPSAIYPAQVRYQGADWRSLDTNQLEESLVAVPVQVRYALTRSFRRRLQLEAVGGAAVVRTALHFREYGTQGYNVTELVVNEFRRESWGVTANLGGALGYGLGRRRRVQATLEVGGLQDLHNLFSAPVGARQFYTKVGLRYRFGYH
ncbi:hypothetical protein [Hymenobacter arcticus]